LNTLARLAYKQNVDDDGESLSCCIIEDLEHVRAVVSNSDPYIPVI
jgi:UDP-N-acetyl-D-mannosaminuronate dehydrogenase